MELTTLPLMVAVPPTVPRTLSNQVLLSEPPESYWRMVTVTRAWAGTWNWLVGPYVGQAELPPGWTATPLWVPEASGYVLKARVTCCRVAPFTVLVPTTLATSVPAGEA